MPSTHQTILQKHSPLQIPSSHSYTVMQYKSTPNDDDDDICPVCESECTCGNTNNSQATASQPPPTPAPAPQPLKIKLPPRKLLNPAPKPPTPAKRAKTKSSKQKLTTAGSATVDGTSSNYIILHHPGPFSALGHQLGAPTPVASTSNILRDASPLTPEPEIQPPLKARGKPKQPSKNTPPKSRKKAATALSKPKQKPRALPIKKTSVATIRGRKNKDATWTTASSRRKGKAVLQPSSDEFDDNFTEDEDTFVARMRVDSDGGDSIQFPTFISAISTTSGADSASVTSDSFDSDSSVRAEEEDMILVEERAKVRHEILHGEESWHMEKRKWDHLKNNNNWEIRPRKKSVGAGETESEADSDSDSEVQAEEEEEEDADDDDPDIRYGRGMVTGWQSDDDFDAELFFATLTDSSGPGSDADAEDGEESGDDQSDDNSDLSAISISEAAAAGLLTSPFGAGCPLVVTEDWDGRLVFANGLKDGQGVLDVHFEVNAAQRHRSIREAMEVDLGEMEDVLEGEDNEDDIFSDDGETTDDMLDHQPGISTPQGVVPMPFRCPTPPVTSIDPLSTFSPITGTRRNRLKGSRSEPSPKPADILANAGKLFWDGKMFEKDFKKGDQSVSTSVASPPETASSSQSRMPSMGSFKPVSGDPKRSAVIDGKKMVPSPFSRNRRVRTHVERGRKRTATGSDIFPYTSKRVRQSSLPDSNRALLPGDADESMSPLIQSSPELPLPAAPIDLDDVLDAAFLDSDDGEAAANTSGERHLRNLTRWDRIPMGTFRRSRTTYMDENSVRVAALVPPPNDGVSYGSAGGHVLRKSPLGAALWQTNSSKLSRQPPGTVPVSPVIFPERDGERTPTNQFPDPLQKPLPGEAGPSKSRKQKRREKKKRVQAPTPNTTNHGFYHVPANVPPLNL